MVVKDVTGEEESLYEKRKLNESSLCYGKEHCVVYISSSVIQC